MSFFDVRKWYSFVTLQPPAHEVRLQRERRGIRDNYRAPPGYVDIAPTCDSRWDWDRSLRERPRKPSRQLRQASSERALADDSSSQPATPRSYLRRANDRAQASAGEESPAGTDVLSSSWEAGTPRSEGSRKNYSPPPPRVSLDDSVLYERISRVINAEDLKDFPQQVKQEPSPPAAGSIRGQTVAGHAESLQQPPAGNTAENAEDTGYQSLPRYNDVPRSSGRWGAKLFGQARKSAIYQQVQKGKKKDRVKHGQDELLAALPAESEQNEQRPLSGDLGPPVPVKTWEMGSSPEGEEKSSGTSSTESKEVSSVPSWRLEPPAALGDDQSKQSTLTHVSSLSTEEGSAKQQLPSQFEEAPRRSGKWGRKFFDRLKSKQRGEGEEEQKEKQLASSDYENSTVAGGASSHLLASDAAACSDEVAMKSNAQVEDDKEKSNQEVEGSSATLQKEDIATPGDNAHILLATHGQDKSVQERDEPPALHSTVKSADITCDFPLGTADKTNELALLMQERGTEPVCPEKVPFSPPAQPPSESFFKEVDEPKSPSKSPGKKKGSFFKLPSLKKKKKLSASNIEEPPPPPNPEQLVALEPEKSLSFDEILAELRKQHSKQLSPASVHYRPPLHGSLKKVPPPVPPKTWKTTANLAIESQESEGFDGAEDAEPIEPLPLATEKIPFCETVVPLPEVVPSTQVISPECSVPAQEATADATTAESLQLPIRSFFDQEHEVTVLQKGSEDVLSSSPTEWNYATFLRGYSQDFLDGCPRKRHNLRLLADTMGSGDASPTITEARNIHLTESVKREAMPDLPSNPSPVKPVDVPLPIGDSAAPGVQQEYFLYRPEVESTGVSRTKLSIFKSKKKKEDEFEDSYREVVTAACERFESSTDVSRASPAPDFSLAQSLPQSSDRRHGDADPAAFTMGTSQEFGEPIATKERRFSFKMSSLRKKKVDKLTKKPDSHEQPRILASLRQENKPRLPVDKGSMMDAYLRSLETQPRSQPHNRSDDSLDLSFVS